MPLIRHAKGHQNHLHIRFYNPLAQEMGRRAYPSLARAGEIHSASFITHKARKGDTLGSLARRYGTTVDAIQRANNLRSNAIQAKHVYRIPKKGRVLPPPGPVVIPPRRLPPVRSVVSARSVSAPQR
jgi:penicillin-insensitive murein endopeptidase